MANLNYAVFIGNLTRDVEVKDFGENKVAKFAVAVNGRKYKNKAGEEVQDTLFMECETWNALAGIVEQYTKKGDRVRVSGSVKQENWEDKTTGTQRSKLVLKVDDFEFLSNKPGSSTLPNEPATNEPTDKPAAKTTTRGRPKKVVEPVAADANAGGGEIPF